MPSEVFALTDEQILGMETERQEREGESTSATQLRERGDGGEGLTPEGVSDKEGAAAHDGKGEQAPRENGSAQASLPVPQEPPGWLAREMKDPWVGDEARELWDGVQRAQREAAAYREAFATPEDARALKEIYPGGVAEAKSAAERARELAEIDAVFFGAAGKPAEELRAGRTAFVEKLYAQDPVVFREMVEAGVRILGMGGRSGEGGGNSQDATILPRSLRSVAGASNSGAQEKAGHSGRDDRPAHEQGARALEKRAALAHGSGAQPLRETSSGQAGMPVPQEVASRYREFERATNAELEKSVGGAIGRAMEAALPNLRRANVAGGEGPLDARGKQASSLQERLATAVREEVEAALKSDASLGEQVAKVLSGRRFDEAARAQVVRLIDARAQQLVPGAVRRVVGSWTAATLGGRKVEATSETAGRNEQERRGDRGLSSPRRTGDDERAGGRNERAAGNSAGRNMPRGRVDYRKFSDEQILEM